MPGDARQFSDSSSAVATRLALPKAPSAYLNASMLMIEATIATSIIRISFSRIHSAYGNARHRPLFPNRPIVRGFSNSNGLADHFRTCGVLISFDAY